MGLKPLIIVVFSAFLHAIWNLLYKRSEQKIIFIWAALVFSLIFYLPLFLIIKEKVIPFKGWTFILTTGLIHTLYFVMLGYGYKIGDLSLIYPLSRSAPLFVLLWAFIFIHEQLSFMGIIGIFLTVLGAYLIGIPMISRDFLLTPFFHFRDKSYQMGILIALIVSIYSIVDSQGVKIVHPFIYIYLNHIIIIILLGFYIFSKYRDLIVSEIQNRWKEISLVGIIDLFSYLLILYVMRIAQVSYIVSVRQVSIIFGILLSAFFLKEKSFKWRLASGLFIFLGVFIIGIKG